MCTLNNYLNLLRERDWQLGQNIDAEKASVVDLYYRLFIDPTDPMESSELPGLIQKISME